MNIYNYMNIVFYTLRLIKVNCITIKHKEVKDYSPHKLFLLKMLYV